MRSRVLVLVMLGSMLGGCVTPEQRQAFADRQAEFMRDRPRCYDEKACERMWSAARNWVINNCRMKIQNITDGYIETFNSVDVGLACRVTKDPLPDNGYVLTVTTGCGNIFGCFPDAWQAAFDFNYQVRQAAPLPATPPAPTATPSPQ